MMDNHILKHFIFSSKNFKSLIFNIRDIRAVESFQQSWYLNEFQITGISMVWF